MRNPLRGEALNVFHAVKGGIVEKLTDQAEPFVIGDMSGRFVFEGLPAQVLQSLQQLGASENGNGSRARDRFR